MQNLVADDEIIDSVAKIASAFLSTTGISLKYEKVRQVMVNECGLKWKKIRMLSLLENSTANLILRQ